MRRRLELLPMILTLVLEPFASAANNGQNKVFCAGSTMDVNDVVKASVWLFFPISDTILCKKEKNNRLRKIHTKKHTTKLLSATSFQHGYDQNWAIFFLFFFFVQYFVRRNELENCRVWVTFCLDSHDNVIHRNQKRAGMANRASVFPWPRCASLRAAEPKAHNVASRHLRRGRDGDLGARADELKLRASARVPAPPNASSSFPVFFLHVF